MRFAPSHEWASLEGEVATVGLSSFARKELGEIVHVELPKVGQLLHAGDVVCLLESNKSASEVYTPLSGRVLSIHERLRDHPELLNKWEEEVWLFTLKVSDLSEYDQLLSHEI